MRNDLFDKIQISYMIIVLLIYLIISPILLVLEYQNNEKFKDLMYCNEKTDVFFNELTEGCKFHKTMSGMVEKSNLLILFTILIFAGTIFEKDIWPNREKIKKWLREHDE